MYLFSFVGCVDLQSVIHSGSTLQEKNQVIADCIDACSIQTCQNGGKCLNNFKNVTCDCVGTGYEGDTCDKSK